MMIFYKHKAQLSVGMSFKPWKKSANFDTKLTQAPYKADEFWGS